MRDFPVAYDAYAREISLPIYPELNQEKIEYIVGAVTSSYANVMNG